MSTTPAPIYPSWRYHATLPARQVQSADEADQLGADWADSPAKFAKGPDGKKAPEPPVIVPVPPAAEPSYVTKAAEDAKKAEAAAAKHDPAKK